MADQNDIAKQWLSFDGTRRSALLAKMSPEQKRNLRLALEQLNKGGSPTSAPAQDKPGVLSRTLQGLGLPSTMKELENAKPSTAEVIGGPAVTAGKMVASYANNLYEEGKHAGQEAFEAGTNVGEGGPLGANIGKGIEGLSEFVLKGVLGPVGGGAIQAWGEDITSKNYSGAAGDALAVLINAAMFKGSRPLDTSGKVSKISYATDISRGVEDLKTVLPDIEKASKGGPPKTVGDLLDTVNKAKTNMNTESGLAMHKIKGQQYVPIDIANQIKSRITPDMVQTAEGRHVQTMLQDAALDFQKPWTFEQLDALRMRWNSELSGYWKMNPAERTAFLKSHPEAGIQVAVVEGIKDIVYPAMDKAAGKPVGYFAGLKQRQSTLITLQKSLEGRADELETQTSKIKGSPRMDQSNLSFYGAATSGSAHPGLSLHRLHEVIKRPNPAARADAAISRSFNGRPISKAFIYSYPLRKLLLDDKKQEKKPAEQLKDLRRIQEQHSSNPAMPAGEER